MNSPSAPGRPELAGGAKNKPVNLSGSSAHPESCTLKRPIPQLRYEGFSDSKHMSSVGIAVISEGWLHLKRPGLTRSPLKCGLSQDLCQSRWLQACIIASPHPETPLWTRGLLSPKCGLSAPQSPLCGIYTTPKAEVPYKLMVHFEGSTPSSFHSFLPCPMTLQILFKTQLPNFF